MLRLNTVIFLISFLLLAVIHAVAIELSLYWHFPWFDIAMHFFGGAIVALGVYVLGDLRMIPRTYLTKSTILACVLVTATVWEVFEVYAGIPILPDYVFDTALDLLMGMLGGYVGYIVGRNIGQL